MEVTAYFKHEQEGKGWKAGETDRQDGTQHQQQHQAAKQRKKRRKAETNRNTQGAMTGCVAAPPRSFSLLACVLCTLYILSFPPVSLTSGIYLSLSTHTLHPLSYCHP